MQSSIYKYCFSTQREGTGRLFSWGIQHKHRLEILGMKFVPENWTLHEIIESNLQHYPFMSYHLIKLIELYSERHICISDETIVVLECLIPITGFYK